MLLICTLKCIILCFVIFFPSIENNWKNVSCKPVGIFNGIYDIVKIFSESLQYMLQDKITKEKISVFLNYFHFTQQTWFYTVLSILSLLLLMQIVRKGKNKNKTVCNKILKVPMLLQVLSHFSHVWLCVTP